MSNTEFARAVLGGTPADLARGILATIERQALPGKPTGDHVRAVMTGLDEIRTELACLAYGLPGVPA